VCPLGTYNLDGDPSNGCETHCTATQCTGADGGVLPLDALPPFLVGAQYSNRGVLVTGASDSEPMTSSQFTEGGALGDPGAGPAMTGSRYQNQGGLAR
jgi:hypothetical protein